MRKLTVVLLILIASLSVYLLLWPVPIKPVAWRAPAVPGYVGAHSPNTRLANIRLVSVAPEVGPEHITAGPDGKLYTGVLYRNPEPPPTYEAEARARQQEGRALARPRHELLEMFRPA